jgi:hypothetical protein
MLVITSESYGHNRTRKKLIYESFHSQYCAVKHIYAYMEVQVHIYQSENKRKFTHLNLFKQIYTYKNMRIYAYIVLHFIKAKVMISSNCDNFSFIWQIIKPPIDDDDDDVYLNKLQ